MTKSELQELLNLRKDSEFLKRSYNSLRKKYENEYIAIKNQNIIAHNKKMEDLIKVVKEKRIDPSSLLIEFLHPKDMILVL